MSEFRSFYLQAHIKKQDFKIFLEQPCHNIKDYTDIKEWFLSKTRMYGDAKTFIETYPNHFDTNYHIQIQQMVEHATYDEKQELLILDNINIGESFEIFIQYLIVLRGIAPYVIKESQNNFMVIYPFWWGDREVVNKYAEVYVEFKEGTSIISDMLNEENMQIATSYFTEHADEFSQEFYKKYGYF